MRQIRNAYKILVGNPGRPGNTIVKKNKEFGREYNNPYPEEVESYNYELSRVRFAVLKCRVVRGQRGVSEEHTASDFREEVEAQHYESKGKKAGSKRRSAWIC
jgi:hypothetical protein